MSQGKNRLFAVLLVCLSVVASLVIVEVALSLFFPRLTYDRLHLKYPAVFDESDVVPSRLLPGADVRITREEFDTRVKINNLGFRGADMAAEKGDRFRILAVGDSFTFGWGVEDDETYPYLLQALLAGDSAREIEVVNAGGAAGFHPDTYFTFLRQVGLALDPDLIVIGFFFGNDLQINISDDLVWEEVDGEGLPRRVTSKSNVVLENRWMSPWGVAKYGVPVLRDSHLYQLVVHSLSEIDDEIDKIMANYEGTRGKPPRQYWHDYDEDMDRIVERTKRLFRAMKALADQEGIPLVVFMIPAMQQVDVPPDYPVDAVDLDKPQRIFTAFFEAEGIPYVDLLEASRASQAPLYFPRDEHWNVEGQAFGARKLAEFLRDEGLAP